MNATSLSLSASRLTLPIVAATMLLIGAAPPAAPGVDVSKLAGSWTWSWKDPKGETHKHVMEVEGSGSKLAAREIFDDLPPVPVTKLTVDGRSVRFTVVRGDRKAEYEGKLADDDHLKGTVTVTFDGQSDEHVWKAERKKESPPCP